MQKWIYEPSNSLLVLGDFNASYFVFPYEVDPSVEIVIKGQYPHARYMSITVNGTADIPIASAPDQSLIPDPGSTNPFLPGANWDAKNRNYTLIIRFTAPPDSEHFVPGAGKNIIYVGTLPNGRPNASGIITLRIYVPSIGYDKTGGVGLPEIMYCSAKNNRRTHMESLRGMAEPKMQDESLFNQKAFKGESSSREECDLVWSKTNRVQSVLLQANPNTVYIISNEIERNPGKLLYIHWKAPTFPDTYHNIGIVGNENMRYWSMMFATKIGYLGLYTIGDFQTIIDKSGYVNLVISFGAPRPAFVTSKNGFTWVDLSELPLVPFSIIYRNTLVSPTFPYTAKNVPVGEVVPPEVMGKYYPCGKYVDANYFKPYFCTPKERPEGKN